MPKLMKLASLQNMAFDTLLEHVVDGCDHLSREASTDKLRHGISVIKANVCSRLPWKFSADFCNGFLEKFIHQTRPMSHIRIALEMIMDSEIIGLKCDGRILRCLDVSDARRLQTLKILDMGHDSATLATDLAHFKLNDLTTFICHKNCTDLHLEIIAQSCPQLEVVKVTHSSLVTDEGIRALDACPELRVVDILGCSKITSIGLNYLLSSHEKLQDCLFGYDVNDDRFIDDDEIYILSGLDWSFKCPSIRRAIFDNCVHSPSEELLQSFVTKFPNLVYFQVNCLSSENLTPLKALNHLTGLEVHFVYRGEDDQYGFEDTWESIKTLLKSVGANITTLKLSCWDQDFPWAQDEVNFIYDTCPNIECLRFDLQDGITIIPPFQMLKELWPCVPIHNDASITSGTPFAIKFGEMLTLETLSLRDFPANLLLIKSIMLDNIRFPNLSTIETICVKTEDLVEIERIARANNLDFKVKNDPASNRYRHIEFGKSIETADHIYFNLDTESSDPEGSLDNEMHHLTPFRERFDRADLFVVGPRAPRH